MKVICYALHIFKFNLLFKENNMQLIKYDDVKSKIIILRNQSVIIDSFVAELYGVETKQLNQAVSRNPEKFP